MARQRNYAAEYERRNAAARAAGFKSYYDQRVRGGAAATPRTPKPSGVELRQRAGHGKFRAFLRAVQPESLIMISSNLGDIERTDTGWSDVPLVVYTPDGDEIEFEFSHISEEELDWLIAELEDYDVDYSPDYDLRSLAPQ